ncbi:phosphotransferase family protein [Clostridium oryzae]|uniref:Homoserine kinase n=1 Tax=Clostridium oryzae TaxID=1450648 RepID=A0A1V4IXV8_9CLOT|nr:aminoglycoside phosphotransferase family protein [Clostridium oryzae]OPJ64786.1 homoserine kinase [Clostridium oryzae]
MHSRTKANISEENLLQMIEVAGIKDLINVEELTGGEFNVAYMIHTETARYILKIGPSEGTNMLTYEKGIMEVELWAYEQLRKHTDIKIPEILHSGHEIIGNHWFIMSVLPGKLLCDVELTEEQLYHWQYQFGEALAQMHNIKNEKFGYTQVGLHDTWKDAYYDMIFNLIEDAEKQGNMLPELSQILRFIRKWEGALEEVKVPRLIHYDLFDNNVFIDKAGNFAGLIDTERCFFGDYYADFFAIDFLGHLEDNKGLIDGYNSAAEEKIEFTPYARARVALSRLMLGLLMFTEGTTRLALSDPQHWERKHLASLIINFALHELD